MGILLGMIPIQIPGVGEFSLGMAGGLYWRSFVESTRRHIWADTSRALPLLPAALGVDAGLIGAAATIFQKLDQ